MQKKDKKEDETKKRIAFSHKPFFSHEQRRTQDVFLKK